MRLSELDSKSCSLQKYQPGQLAIQLHLSYKLTLAQHIRWHADHQKEAKNSSEFPSPDMALSETLKLMFSLAKQYPQSVDFQPAIRPAISVLNARDSATTQKDEAQVTLVNHLIDALHVVPIDTEDLEAWFPTSSPDQLVTRLIHFLSMGTAKYKPAEMDLKLSTTVILLLHLYRHAPGEVKASMREQLLPREEERDKPLGQSETLPARLLRLSTSGFTPQLRELIPELFFEMSDRNAETFVNNVGYGYASGYLTNNKIPFVMPGANGQAQADGQGSANGMRTDVNPVTGQFLAHEPQSDAPPMTEEEKMAEAERLFVLFERLKATGVVDVKNPVEEAARSGKLEELDESDE